MAIEVETNLDYLIPELRLHLGDTDETAYRYTDAWLRTSLVMSVKALMRWWNYKYLIDTSYNASRNPRIVFLFPSPPTIEYGDEYPIILMASIIIKEGSLEESAWSTGAWRDAEIAYSNIEGNKARTTSLKQDWDTLESILKPPQKRLAQSKKGSTPGYLNNRYERGTKL
jgi:hypothetical protein